MLLRILLVLLLLSSAYYLAPGVVCEQVNSTFNNPILPGFHPDPSCIFLQEWNNTFFCASSSFNVFPGIPIHASKDLKNWKLIGHVLSRQEQLPRLAETNRSTSGIWAPTLRYHDETFWLVTTVIIFHARNPFDSHSWSKAIHFRFEGYDTEPFWDDDGKSYITGAHAWKVGPRIEQTEVDLRTGEVNGWKTIWKGTGGTAPEGPHIYRKDGYYYLLAAEGTFPRGTGLDHMVTIARSKNLDGPFESNPGNPILSNANTTNYFQTVGHADLFQDASKKWWGVALSTRAGATYLNFPMVRETVLTSVTWDEGDWPRMTQISGKMSGWEMPRANFDVNGPGPWISNGEVEGDDIDFAPSTKLPSHFAYWRYPIETSYTISPPEHHHSLRLTPSTLNLTGLNGNYAGPTGQTFVGRRQQDTLFTYSVTVDFAPTIEEEEAGVSAFLTQNHHFDLGVVLLPAMAGTQAVPGYSLTGRSSDELRRHIRFRGISYVSVPDDIIAAVPEEWEGKPLSLQIKATNMTHYAFSAGPAGAASQMRTIVSASNDALSWGFTGVLLGVYSTSNGGSGSTPAYISDWKYVPQGQYRD
ncbi:Non-reducing end alpha-L-arabinofuranosidase BoGH43B [Colletotrichum orbiculare MAFF 240422]|uniref:Non-reducing end alpha-L-arabinofuranosidase BoGH43B n=1 Tax=Colletotrichum orbiculare (strain 104-T / ATCC 96160 / CBS 514.97 / LARS 414 / MAFF 240422) TaxID=1213857 RepID=A0A484G5R5_COLOR|nr:Non-reducing end alpha-L-arabinofuranosidase BoGH43B [Colletotrichum orbiculare MAFF 240422]